jgi:hypothetical protein
MEIRNNKEKREREKNGHFSCVFDSPTLPPLPLPQETSPHAHTHTNKIK